MNNSYNIVLNDDKSSIKFSIISSPYINKINFIKDTINTKSKRIYVRAEVKIKEDNSTKYIFDYYKGEKIAYLSYIELIKKKYNIKNNKTYKLYTVLHKNNTTRSNIRNKYYNKQYNTVKHFTISKGYGRLLLLYIEEYLKNKGINYLILIPSKKSLIPYYEHIGYKIEYVPNNAINKENNNEQLKYNKEAVSQYMIMYKEL
jgi:hypothetical protein